MRAAGVASFVPSLRTWGTGGVVACSVSGTEVRTSSPFCSCHTVHVVTPLTPCVVTSDSPTKRSAEVVVVSEKGISAVSVAGPRVTRWTSTVRVPASSVDTATRSRGWTAIPASCRVARASWPGRASICLLVPSALRTTERCRETRGVSESREEERSAARDTLVPRAPASARIASAEAAVVHTVRTLPSTATE